MFAKIVMLAAALFTQAASADVSRPEAYDSLTAVSQKPGQAPRLVHGVSDLSAREGRHQERLPLQLDGAIQKIKRTKYSPKREAKAVPAKQKARVAKAKNASRSFKVEAMVSPAKKGKSRTHPVGFEESLPMPAGAAPAKGPVAIETPDHF